MSSPPFEFNAETMEHSVQYLCDSIAWLNNVDMKEVPKLSKDANRRMLTTLSRRLRHALYAVGDVGDVKQRSQLININQLPPEILGHIFVFVQDLCATTSLTPNTKNRHEWTVISFVCRYWRQVALTTPYLWTIIDIPLLEGREDQQQGFVSEQLARSGCCPLTVLSHEEHLTLRTEKPSIRENLLEHSHRIKNLRLRLKSCYSDISFWIAKVPQLESLEINADGGLQLSLPHTAPLEVVLPRLHTLALSNYSPRTIGAFRGLRRLLIESPRDGMSLTDNPRDLLDVLSYNADTLEDLAIKDDMAIRDSSAMPNVPAELNTYPPVKLRALKHVHLSCGPLLREIFLSKVIVPAGSARDYNLHRRDGCTPADLHRLAANKLFINSVFIVATDGTSALRTRHLGIDSPPPTFICGTNVQELWMSMASLSIFDFETTPAMTIFTEMRNVTKLVIACYDDVLLKFITNNRLFPALVELELRTQTAESSAAVVDFVTDRKHAGRPIETLRFVDRNTNTHLNTIRDTLCIPEDVVSNVLFVDTPTWAAPKMDLPTVCVQESFAHAYDWGFAWWGVR
ncbi:hypothetical protein BDW22DRAFT_1343165 [Trametopsis cervina]|nr:hypothetical protein BDW22DRAFT_1343165 [Trametopsis cervina]